MVDEGVVEGGNGTTTEGVVEEPMAPKIVEVNRGDVVPGRRL